MTQLDTGIRQGYRAAYAWILFCLGTTCYSALHRTLHAQEGTNSTASATQVGERVGNIEFPLLLNMPMSRGTLADFSGKLVLLDLWATWCSPCIGRMPYLQAIQQQFADKVQVLLVASDDVQQVKAFYAKRPGLALPTAVGSSEFFPTVAARFSAPTLGTYIWIQDGRVRAITGEDEVTPENVQAVLDRKPVHLTAMAGLGARQHLDLQAPFMVSDNDGGVTELLYHSVLTPFMPGRGSGGTFPHTGKYADRRLFFYNVPVVSLFGQAVASGKQYGRWSTFPMTRTILEVSDTTGLRDFKHSENLYCYELIVPERLKEQRYGLMLRELENTFGLTARVERRLMPVLILRAKDKGPPLSTGGATKLSVEPLWVVAHNVSVARVAEALEEKMGIPVLDETGLTKRIDWSWDGVAWSDRAAVRAALATIGLELRDARRDIPVMVIRDLR